MVSLLSALPLPFVPAHLSAKRRERTLGDAALRHAGRAVVVVRPVEVDAVVVQRRGAVERVVGVDADGVALVDVQDGRPGGEE